MKKLDAYKRYVLKAKSESYKDGMESLFRIIDGTAILVRGKYLVMELEVYNAIRDGMLSHCDDEIKKYNKKRRAKRVNND